MLRLWHLHRLPDLQGVASMHLTQSIEDSVYTPETSGDGSWVLGRGALTDDRQFGFELWKREREGYRKVLERHLRSEKYVASATLSPDGRYLVAVEAGDESRWEVRLWTLVDGLAETLLGSFSSNNNLATPYFSPDGRWLAVRSSANKTRIWDLRSEDRSNREFEGGPTDFDRYKFDAESRSILLGIEDGPVTLLRLAEGRVIPIPQSDSFERFDFDPTASWISGHRRNGTLGNDKVGMWRLREDQADRVEADWQSEVDRVVFAPRGAIAVGVRPRDIGGVYIVELASLSVRQLPFNMRGKAFAGFSADGKWIVTQGKARTKLAAWPTEGANKDAPVLLDGFEPPDPNLRGQEQLSFSPGGAGCL